MPPGSAPAMYTSKNYRLALACTIVTLMGCGNKEPVQTVDWYMANEAARKAVIQQCNSNPGELRATPNCINATAAAHQLQYKVPPPSDRHKDAQF